MTEFEVGAEPLSCLGPAIRSIVGAHCLHHLLCEAYDERNFLDGSERPDSLH